MPALTGLGLAEFVMLRSASVALATAMVEVAVLFAGFVSWVVVATVVVSVMIVPAVVPAFTFNTTGKLAVAPGATFGFEQLIEPTVVQVHPAGTGARETNTVLAGMASVNVAEAQLLGPVLVTTCV